MFHRRQGSALVLPIVHSSNPRANFSGGLGTTGQAMNERLNRFVGCGIEILINYLSIEHDCGRLVYAA
jgi:hypothetical protein